ncbi:hypothetical protein ACFL0O_10595 [Thermodesulfobacteriota bacterium]
MKEIQLDDGTINVDGEWLSVDDLTNRIQEKMQAGEMKFTNLATALEELNAALENSHTLEVRIVITKDEYEKLKALGGEDDRESIRRAIVAFVGGADHAEASEEEVNQQETSAEDLDEQEAPVEEAAAPLLTIDCPHPQCMSPIEITTDERPTMIECSNCGVSGTLTVENTWAKPVKE